MRFSALFTAMALCAFGASAQEAESVAVETTVETTTSEVVSADCNDSSCEAHVESEVSAN